MRALVLAAVGLAGCVRALSPEDATSLREAQQLDVRAYQLAGPSTPAGAMARGAYCATAAVARRADAGTYDSKGLIACAAGQ